MNQTRVLVVDDDYYIRRMECEVLALEGYVVDTAEHGGPALEYMRASKEGLVVLLGLMMPEVDGEMVLRAVVSDEALAARHRIVIVTGSRWWANAPQMLALRARLQVPMVAKPYTVSQLLSAVEDAARRLHTTRDETRRAASG